MLLLLESWGVVVREDEKGGVEGERGVPGDRWGFTEVLQHGGSERRSSFHEMKW